MQFISGEQTPCYREHSASICVIPRNFFAQKMCASVPVCVKKSFEGYPYRSLKQSVSEGLKFCANYLRDHVLEVFDELGNLLIFYTVIAEGVGVSKTTVYYWARGQVPVPEARKPQILKVLSDAIRTGKRILAEEKRQGDLQFRL
jgi:hypothetical protein